MPFPIDVASKSRCLFCIYSMLLAVLVQNLQHSVGMKCLCSPQVLVVTRATILEVYVIYFESMYLHLSCEIDQNVFFIKIQLCRLLVILRSRVLRGVCTLVNDTGR